MLLTSVGTIILVIALGILILLAAIGFKVVPQANAYVVERFGAYHKTLGTGVHFVWPFFCRVSKKVSLKEQVADFDPQPVITKDNVTMQIDTVVFYAITDPKLFTYGVEKPELALEKLTATTLRNIIGEIELDATLTSRDLINSKMRNILDDATDPWGIKVNRVELKNILPPKDIRDAMEKQMRAERERREAILRAEGEKQAQILAAEAKREALIQEADGIKESQIKKAEGEKQAQILAAEAKREALINEAEGQAEAILKIKTAEAKGIEMVKKAGADKAVLTLKAYDALVETSKGNATKLIIPSELQGMAGLVSSITETVKEHK